MKDGAKRYLSRGEVVVMPYGDAHSFGSPEPADPVSITTLFPSPPWTAFPHIKYGGEGERTLVVCGYLRGDAVLFDPVLRALPSLFVVHPPGGPAAAWVTASVEYALMATQSVGAGSRTNQRLPQLLFTEMLRLYLEDSRDGELSDRFHQLLGRPPIRYLTEWRLNLASGLLRTTELGVAEIGAKVGYNSEETFSRAFKRALGRSPAHWRADLTPSKARVR
jgi:hypothetical protein